MENIENIDWEKHFENELKKEKFIEYGKKGGRPIKDQKRTERVHIRMTKEAKKLAIEKADKIGISFPEYCRKAIENKPLPNVEKTKILLEYRTNFNRISNHFKSNIWTEEERKEYLKLIKETIQKLNKEIGL